MKDQLGIFPGLERGDVAYIDARLWYDVLEYKRHWDYEMAWQLAHGLYQEQNDDHKSSK